MSKTLDDVHRAAAALTEDATPREVLAVLADVKAAAWPDGRTLAPGTLAWLVGDFLPRWIEASA